MCKSKEKSLIDWTDDIILLNDKYFEKGLKKGFIGVVVENFIQSKGVVLADFFNPITGEDIAVLVEIGKDDFRPFVGTEEDQRIGKAFKQLFIK
ncbi:MAG: hypothetical protein E7369_03075 [Clostridiales bacterium]|nr:hypothetical protein [Clostridiales bacterium]